MRIDPEALDGKNQIEAIINSAKGSEIFNFDLDVEDTRTDFEVSIKDYDFSTNILTFEILNTGSNDIEALTIDIPKQDNIAVKGSKRNIVGNLDSNDDTTFNFEAIPKNGEIKLTSLYTDKTNERRTIIKNVTFDSSYFEGRIKDKKSLSKTAIIAIVIAAIIILLWVRRKLKNKKHRAIHHKTPHKG